MALYTINDDPVGRGWPQRAGRNDFSAGDMRDEKRLPDPRKYLGAGALNLAFWQLGALGMLAPKAVLHFVPHHPDTDQPRLMYGAFAWDPVTHTDLDAPFPWFEAAIADIGDYGTSSTLTFDTQVPGMDGEMLDLAFVGALAHYGDVPGVEVPAYRVRASAQISDPRTMDVYVRGNNLFQPVPFVLVLW